MPAADDVCYRENLVVHRHAVLVRAWRHDTSTRRGIDWRTLVVVAALALVGATSTSTLWHGEHGADQDCAVCQLRQQSAADISAGPVVGRTLVPRPLVLASVAHGAAAELDSLVPARAPPA